MGLTIIDSYDDGVAVGMPFSPLSDGAMSVLAHKYDKDFGNNRQILQSCYTHLKKIANAWEQRGINDYLIFTQQNNSTTSFQIIPYPKTCFPFWRKFQVLWNISFMDACFSKKTVAIALIAAAVLFASKATAITLAVIVVASAVFKYLTDIKPLSKEDLQKEHLDLIPEAPDATNPDPFCKPDNVKLHLIFSTKTMNVLANKRPLNVGPNRLHFLILPKEHRLKFAELTQEEFVEAMSLSQFITNHYSFGGTKFCYNTNGALAGQSVKHWHHHVIIPESALGSIMGKLHVLRNMTLGSKELTDNELTQRVQMFQKQIGYIAGITMFKQ